MSDPVDIIGMKFGRLTALQKTGKDKWGGTIWQCRCDCGNTSHVLSSSLRKKDCTQSCGCLIGEANSRRAIHGESGGGKGLKYASLRYRLWHGARRRARDRELEFNLALDDIMIPAKCPVFGVLLVPHEERPGANSPVLDRVNNKRGYTKDNVCVISYRANRIKCDATPEELEAIAQYIRAHEPILAPTRDLARRLVAEDADCQERLSREPELIKIASMSRRSLKEFELTIPLGEETDRTCGQIYEEIKECGG